ncbi:MAG TPA: hypothetical protein VGR92_04320 [Steroidobacteraceae bacterium]|nr:hypothetical protein [Steroidobacteraceae bacterium]
MVESAPVQPSRPDSAHSTTASIVVQPSDTPAWVEYAHGAESLVTIVGLIAAGLWAIFGDWRKTKAERAAERELRQNEEHSRREQLKQQQSQRRWDQAKLAREIDKEILADGQAKVALALVDCDTDTYVAAVPGTDSRYSYNFKKKEDVRALRIGAADLDAKEVYLRDCFDAWFYWMAVIESHLRDGFLLQGDVNLMGGYYVRYLKADVELYAACVKYITHYGIGKPVLDFLDRFEAAKSTNDALTA